MIRTYQGSCHCGKVRFEADIDLDAGTGKCNCSICSKVRLWGVVVRPDAFRLLAGEADLSDYQYGSSKTHHRFCQTCGVQPFWHGYSVEKDRPFYTINVACLDHVTDEELAHLSVRYYDGYNNNWQSPLTVTRHL